MPEIQLINPVCDDDDDCGARGKRGKRGHRGHRGHDGHDGDTGPTGPTGPTGAQGPPGPPDPNTPIHLAPANWLLDVNFNVEESGAQARSVIATGDKFATIDFTPFLVPGDTIREFVARWMNGATPSAGEVRFQLLRTPVGTGTSVQIALAILDTNTGGPLIDRSHTEPVGHVVLANNYYSLFFEMDATAGNDQAGFAGATIVLEP